MRIAVFAVSVLALAACQQADAPAEDGADFEIQETPNLPDDPPGVVRLRGDGVDVTGAAGTSLDFRSPRETVEVELARALGEATETGTQEECGAGPVNFTTYPGGLTVNFQDGQLAGWLLQGVDEDEGGGEDIATVDGLAIGSDTQSDFEPVQGSTLGEEFTLDGGIAGLTEGGRVQTLYAGVNCFFR